MRNKTGESLWLPDGWGWKVEMTTGLKIGFASSRQFNALSLRGQQRDVSTMRLFAEIRSLLTLTYEKQSRSDCSLNRLRQSPPWLVVKSGSSWKKIYFWTGWGGHHWTGSLMTHCTLRALWLPFDENLQLPSSNAANKGLITVILGPPTTTAFFSPTACLRWRTSLDKSAWSGIMQARIF